MDINSFYIGQKATMSKVFSQEEVQSFAEISLDKNPLHLDEDFAKQSIFKSRICHGFLIGSLISATFAMKLPGAGAIYKSQNLIFKKPVYAGNTITAEVEIIEIIVERKILKFSTKCYNQNGETVIDGEAVLII